MNEQINQTVRRCSRCIMDDSSDPTITFNERGECNYCIRAERRKKTEWFPNEQGEAKLKQLVAQIKQENRDKEYDCIMGLSGGLDSSYLLYVGYLYGLRILCVHIDDGYDTEVSKRNLNRLIQKTGCRYEVIKPDPEQFNALTKAYMHASVPNLAVPQDNLIFSYIYERVRKTKINTFLSGSNFSLECILQSGNTFDATDFINIRDIHRRFGTKPIDKLTFTSYFNKYMRKHIYHVRTYTPLNYVPYTRDRALKELDKFCGFEYYGSKHLENDLTAFIQLYWFPKKFGVDKRTSHLSSMILSGQLTRDEALEIYAQPLYDPAWMEQLISRILQQLEMSRDEFDKVMKLPPKQHTDYRVSKFPKFVTFLNRHGIPF